MLVKFQPLLKNAVGCKPQKITNSCFRDYQTALMIGRCRKLVVYDLTEFFRDNQPLIACFIDRVVRGETPLTGKRLFQEIFSNDRRGKLFVQLRHGIQQIISRHFHMRSFELAMVTAQLDNLISLQQLCRPALADSLQEYYYSLVTVTVATNFANKAFDKGLGGFGLPWVVNQVAGTVEWGSIWMAAAGFKPAVEKRRCATLLNQALQGLMTNWQLTIEQELLRSLTALLYDLYDQAEINGIHGKQRIRPIVNYQISQRLRQAI